MNPGHDITLAAQAFGKQAEVFDQINNQSVIINWMRRQAYGHVLSLLQLSSRILELNAGTGIDACFFAQKGHEVLATDVSGNMLEQAKLKVQGLGLGSRVRVRQCSFTDLHAVHETGFDLIFSNFGGLNCSANFAGVGSHFPALLKPGGYVCLVMISPFCFWETLLALRGNFRVAFRRFKKAASSNVEGVSFTTYYYAPSEIRKALGKDFKWVSLRSLATFTPPPYLEEKFRNNPGLLKVLNRLDKLTEGWPVFRSAGDHFIATFQYKPES